MRPSFNEYPFRSLTLKCAVWAFDIAGYTIKKFTPTKLFSHAPKKILVVRTDSLGDILMTLPAIDCLKRYYSEAELHILTSNEGAIITSSRSEKKIIFKKNWHTSFPFIEKLRETVQLIAKLRSEKYDLAIDFRGDFRNILMLFFSGIRQRVGYGVTGGGFLLTHCARYPRGIHASDMNKQLISCLGIDSDTSIQPIVYSDALKQKFLLRFSEFNDPSVFRIAIHAGAGYPSKRWPAEYFTELIRSLTISSQNICIFLIGTRKEKEDIPLRVESVTGVQDFRGKTFLTELPILLDQCHLYIGNDSGPAHLAAMQGLPLAILFSGTNVAEHWMPISEHIQLFRHNVSCSPCSAPNCPLGHHDCMKKIIPSYVAEYVLQWIPKLQSGQKWGRQIHEV